MTLVTILLAVIIVIQVGQGWVESHEKDLQDKRHQVIYELLSDINNKL